jgi:hypothetical protein
MLEPQTFLTNARMDTLWENFHWILFFVAPVIMIWFALEILPYLVNTIRGAMKESDKEDDDDDYDVYKY